MRVQPTMDVEDEGDGDPIRLLRAHQLVDRIAVARELALVAVADPGVRLANESAGARGVDLVAFDRGRCTDRLHPRLVCERREQLAKLVEEQALTPLADVDTAQEHADPRGLRGKGATEVEEALHDVVSTY